MNDIIASGAIQGLKSLFHKKTEHNVIIDPFSCLIKLSLLRFLDAGTKISIHNNCLYFNSPTYVQGIIRFMYGDNREHLHNLYLPIQKSVEWYWNDKNNDMTYIFNNAVVGLKMLKNAYSEYATIQHTLDYYIIILMQKNATLIAKMGIKSLDIDTLTNELLNDNDVNNTIATNDTNTINNTNTTNNTSNDTNISSNNTNTSNKNKHKNKQRNETTDYNCINTINNNNTIETKEEIKKENYQEPTKETININKLKDIHKFLYGLWNEREINIVINLYKELESKQHTEEKTKLYDNLMNYCSMKETKLNKYIEQISSVL
jgi:hypothetical protein